jgi:hypothetical protein
MDGWKEDVNSTDRPLVSREESAAMIQALLRERASCEQRGFSDRVKLINAELRRFGHEAEKPAERAEKRPAAQKSAKR